MKKRIVALLVLVLCMVVEVAKADFTFGTPTNLGPTVDSSGWELSPKTSADGLSLYFTSNRPGGYGLGDLWVATRETIDDDWGTPVNLGTTFNTSSWDEGPCISTDELELYFTSQRLGLDFYNLYVSTRTSKDEPWGVPSNLGAVVNDGLAAFSDISTDGLSLYFTSGRVGGFGHYDIYILTRATKNDPWGEPMNLGPPVNGPFEEATPDISANGLALFFCGVRPGGYGDYDLWVTTRPTTNENWGKPVNLGSEVNTAYLEAAPHISGDGSTLYFHSNQLSGGSNFDILQSPIEPVVDLNGDGIVDAQDMCIIVDNWHTESKLCDIAPAPLGDGFVDVQDLVVLSEHLFEEYPPAESVEVSEDDSGRQVELERGQILVITLESNPSTGYRWEQAENNESILEQIGEPEFKSSETSDPPIVGAGGREIFRFRAVSAGQMLLLFFYHRSWEDAEPLKTFSIQVVVP